MNKIVTSENIQAILAAGESDTVEFKTKVRSSIHVLPKILYLIFYYPHKHYTFKYFEV